MSRSLTFLCISCYFKGADFLKACKKEGNRVLLLTKKSLESAPWPKEAIDEFFYLEKDDNSLQNFDIMTKGLAFLIRSERIDRVVALDDFDVEKGAFLREQFRIPGMGQTTARFFRDKLAMRIKAQEANILVPPFSALFSDDVINEFADNVPAPWMVKPRSEASAIGVKKVYSKEELWHVLHALGNERHLYLVEQFKPGDVYHADSLSVNGEVVFCRVSKYMDTPFEIAHGGGVFRSATVEFGGVEDYALQRMNARVMQAFGMQFSASHTEFIKSREDGRYYFLETSSRVGGAHIAEMVEVSSGVNLWAEWAKIESAVAKGHSYQLPPVKQNHAGIIVSLSRFETPDTSMFNDPEVTWKVDKPYHVGLIVKSPNHSRIIELLDNYLNLVYAHFHASLPPRDKPVD